MSEARLKTPWVTMILIVANLAAAFWVALQTSVAGEFGFRADQPTLVAATASLFLHVNLLHLLGNMVFLAAVGPAVEQYAGWLKTAVVYFLGGFLGILAHWAFYRNASGVGPYLGASACIAALIGYGAVRFWTVKVPVAPKLMMPAWSLALVWLALQIAGMLVKLGSSEGGVAYAAHIGGLLAGLGLSLVLKAHVDAEGDLSRRELRKTADLGPMASRVAAEQVLKRRPDDLQALTDLAESYQGTGEDDLEQATWLKVILLERASDDLKIRAAERMTIVGGLEKLPSHRRLRLAESAPLPVAERLLKSIVYGDPRDPMRPSALLALATLEKGGSWVQALVEEFPLDPATEMARGRGLL